MSSRMRDPIMFCERKAQLHVIYFANKLCSDWMLMPDYGMINDADVWGLGNCLCQMLEHFQNMPWSMHQCGLPRKDGHVILTFKCARRSSSALNIKCNGAFFSLGSCTRPIWNFTHNPMCEAKSLERV